MTARGRIFRSRVETRRTPFAWLSGNGFAIGDVRMCRNNHNGTVTVKVIFCKMNPTVPTLQRSAVPSHLVAPTNLQAHDLSLVSLSHTLHQHQHPSRTKLPEPKDTEQDQSTILSIQDWSKEHYQGSQLAINRSDSRIRPAKQVGRSRQEGSILSRQCLQCCYASVDAG